MFEIIFDSNREEQHSDIVINISDIGFSAAVDSYYLRIDPLIMPAQEDSAKVVECLKLMISGWITTIKGLGVNEKAYLPYDFSDQYIGVFKIHKVSSEEISIGTGFTSLYAGFQQVPSRDTILNLDGTEFESEGNDTILSVENLVAQLHAALKVL